MVQAVGCPVTPRRAWQALPFHCLALSHGASHGTPESPSAVQGSHRHPWPGNLPQGILLAAQLRRQDPLPRCQVGRRRVLTRSAAWSAGFHRSRRKSIRGIALVWGGIMAAAVAGWPLRMSQAPAAAMLPIPSATGIGLADRAAPGYRQYGSRDLDRPNLPCFRRDTGKGTPAPVLSPGIAWR